MSNRSSIASPDALGASTDPLSPALRSELGPAPPRSGSSVPASPRTRSRRRCFAALGRYACLAQLVLGCGLVVGCQTSPIREAAAHGDEAADVFCECWEEAGYGSRGECVADADTLTEGQLVCLEEVYERYEGSSAETFECLADAAERLKDCVRSVSGCDIDAYRSCGSRYPGDLAECPRLPPEAQAAFNACF